MKLGAAKVSVFSGSGELRDFVIGNPEGYKTPSAIKVGTVGLALDPSSVLSDKVVVRSVKVESPEITFEGSLAGSNLSKILDNVKAATGAGKSGAKSEDKAASKKLQVDDFLISNAKINISASLLGGKSLTVPLPDIHFTNLGQGSEGITAGDLTEKVFAAILEGTTKAVAGAVGNVGKAAGDALKGAGSTATGAADKVTKGIGDLFKKK